MNRRPDALKRYLINGQPDETSSTTVGDETAHPGVSVPAWRAPIDDEPGVDFAGLAPNRHGRRSSDLDAALRVSTHRDDAAGHEIRPVYYADDTGGLTTYTPAPTPDDAA